MDMAFKDIYKEFERTHDISNFYRKYSDGDVSTRFLLIRSLDNKNLDDLYFEASGEHFDKVSVEDKYRLVFESDLSNNRILEL